MNDLLRFYFLSLPFVWWGLAAVFLFRASGLPGKWFFVSGFALLGINASSVPSISPVVPSYKPAPSAVEWDSIKYKAEEPPAWDNELEAAWPNDGAEKLDPEYMHELESYSNEGADAVAAPEFEPESDAKLDLPPGFESFRQYELESDNFESGKIP